MRMYDIKYLNEGFDFEQAQFQNDDNDILRAILKQDVAQIDVIISNATISRIYYESHFKDMLPSSPNILIEKNYYGEGTRIPVYKVIITNDYVLNIYQYKEENTTNTLKSCNEIANKIKNKEIVCIKNINCIIDGPNYTNIDFDDLHENKIITPSLYKYCKLIIKNPNKDYDLFVDNYQHNLASQFFRWYFSSFTKDTYTNINIISHHKPHRIPSSVPSDIIYKILFEPLNEGFDFGQAQFQNDDISVIDSLLESDINIILQKNNLFQSCNFIKDNNKENFISYKVYNGNKVVGKIDVEKDYSVTLTYIAKDSTNIISNKINIVDVTNGINIINEKFNFQLLTGIINIKFGTTLDDIVYEFNNKENGYLTIIPKMIDKNFYHLLQFICFNIEMNPFGEHIMYKHLNVLIRKEILNKRNEFKSLSSIYFCNDMSTIDSIYKYSTIYIECTNIPITYIIGDSTLTKQCGYSLSKFKEFCKWFFQSYNNDTCKNIKFKMDKRDEPFELKDANGKVFLDNSNKDMFLSTLFIE